ncbi:MAG: S9 family peptidase [Candidatus Eremiobacteraeota bacterium]|nr:S9 family peptidase [Candidatus Eremiobacteraeota bacterium]
MTLPPLIARDLLFGNPENAAPQVSPDATMLAYLAPCEGLLSVWVRGRNEAEARLVAHDPARPIHRIFWQGDSRHILYLQDRAGNENYHLFRVDLAGGTPQELTPGERVKVEILDIDPHFPSDVLLVSNERDERLFDVHRLDLVNGTARLDTENPGDVSGWLADNDFIIRAAVVQNPDGSSLIRVRDDASSPWRTLDRFAFEDGFGGPVAFSPDNRTLFAITAKDANAARLLAYDLASGSAREVAADATYDIASAYVDPATKRLVAVAIARDRLEWIVLDPVYEGDFAALRGLHAGDVSIDGASADGNALVVHYSNDTGPTPYYLYDRSAKSGTLLFYSRPALLEYALAPMQPIVVPARDGLDLHGYLTLPVGLEPRGLPTVMVVHGGPWHRDRFGYDPFAQWLANRGYAVVQVNFRGSTGYGKAFLNAGNREWAGAMRTDLLDARDWLIERGIADPGRFAIFGGSYGGYAVLAALTFTPNAFSCGIDVVGPSNLATLLGSIPPYWETLRATFTKRMGEDEAFLREQSPLFRAADIRVPLLIAQGANDPRVKQQESEQIVAAMRTNGVPVTYILFEDEGHGFVNPSNNKRFTAAAEAFLGRTLGGRVEPAHPGEEIEPYVR